MMLKHMHKFGHLSTYILEIVDSFGYVFEAVRIRRDISIQLIGLTGLSLDGNLNHMINC